MPKPVQTTIYGTTEPLRAPSAPATVPSPPVRLFDAPQTMRGQLAIASDEHSEGPAK